MDGTTFLGDLAKRSQEKFVAEKRVMSFSQYLSLFLERPVVLARNSAQYLKSTLDHYGQRRISGPTGDKTRYGLFDTPFDDGVDRLVGQEEVQQRFYRTLSDFVREGRTSRLVMLHGPNGSAKTSFVQCLARAMVHYSHTDEGSLYSFNWVFPRSSYLGKRVGFESAGEGTTAPDETYAFLDEMNVAALLPGGLRDHPIFLLPSRERGEFLKQVETEGATGEDFKFSEHIRHGDLSPTSRVIFDTLLAAYNGDLSRVLAHVQVERYYLSRRYRKGLVTIEPQMHVDAEIRQITMDESYQNLPAVLRHASIFEMGGDLVDGNRGLLEFSDMLKRPIDSFKYLLGTCESSRITVSGAILYLDILFVGTSNDKYMDAFTKTPDFSSFKGRMEVLRMPFIRDYTVEQEIYDMQVTSDVVGKHVAPHATYVAALWAVLTRMKRCNPELYAETIREVLGKLAPLEKADLYATGQYSGTGRGEVARELQLAVEQMHAESDGTPAYEGSFGASPREIRGVLMAAAHSPEFGCLHPVQVFTELVELVKQRQLYEFLQLPADGEYQDPGALLLKVIQRYGSIVDREFKQAMGLISDDEFKDQLHKYATHASAHLKKETVYDPLTRKPLPPDESFMKELESSWGVTDENRERKREDFIGKLASSALDQPGKQHDFQQIFPSLFDKLKQAYYQSMAAQISTGLKSVLAHLDGTKLEVEDEDTARKVVEAMIERFGYCRECIGPALSFLADSLEADEQG